MCFDCIAGWFCSNLPKETIIMLLGRDHVNGRSAGVTSVGAFLGGHLDIPHNPREREGLYEVFDSMDFDGKLSRGLFVVFGVEILQWQMEYQLGCSPALPSNRPPGLLYF